MASESEKVVIESLVSHLVDLKVAIKVIERDILEIREIKSELKSIFEFLKEFKRDNENIQENILEILVEQNENESDPDPEPQQNNILNTLQKFESENPGTLNILLNQFKGLNA